MKMQKIVTLFAATGMLAVGDGAARTNDNWSDSFEDMSFTRRYLNDMEFTIETIRDDQASNPWCVDAIGCEGGAFCVGSIIGLRVCDPGTHPTQIFTQDTFLFIYLAYSVGLCFQVNFSDQLIVNNCEGTDEEESYGYDEFDRRKLQKSPIAGTRKFDVSGGQLVALADDGSRFPAAIDTDSGSAELIFVDEGDPRVIDVTQRFLAPTHPPTPTPQATKSPKATKGPKSTKAPKSPKGSKTPKTPKSTKGPKTPKAPKATKGPKSTKAPKATKGPKSTKAPKATKGPKSTKEPKATKGPKMTKAPKAPKATKLPRVNSFSY